MLGTRTRSPLLSRLLATGRRRSPRPARREDRKTSIGTRAWILHNEARHWNCDGGTGMQMLAGRCSCVAIVLTGLAAPAMAQDKAMAPVVPTIAVPKITLIPSVAPHAVVPAIAPDISQAVAAVARVGAVPAVVTPAVTIPANPMPAVVMPAIATSRALDVPRPDVIPRGVAISRPGATSRIDAHATLDTGTTKALATKAEVAVAAKAEGAAVTDAGARTETQVAASSTGTVTEAVTVAQAAPGQRRPVVVPSCR